MVDWDGLENRCACKRTVGSNPTLSASLLRAPRQKANSMMVRSALILVAALLSATATQAQGVFDPASVAYVLCVTDEAKKLALKVPPLSDDAIFDQAFNACSDQAGLLRQSLAERNLTKAAIDERFSQIRKFMRHAVQSDIGRVRSNTVPN